MTAPSYQAPRGMRDFYPSDMALRERIFDAWRSAAVSAAFSPYDACVVESLELLKRKAGEEIVDQIYAFQDKSGRELALRPEMTPTLARMVSARAGALSFPIKWYTIAQCFRYERMVKGRKREHYQWNLDIVGEAGVTAEAEILATAFDALRRLGLTSEDVAIRLSHRGLLSALLERLDIPEGRHAAVFLALDKRGKLADSELTDQMLQAGLPVPMVARVFDIFALTGLDEVAALLPATTPALLELRDLMARLEDHGVAEAVRFDISVIRGLAYYTGAVFEGFDLRGDRRAIFGGGRYNGLLSSIGGADSPAVGLGFGDVVIGDMLVERGLFDGAPSAIDMAVGFMNEATLPAAIRFAARRRRDGDITDLALHPEKPKAFFSRADKIGAAKAVYIGPDDVARSTVRLKTLATREEVDVSLTE